MFNYEILALALALAPSPQPLAPSTYYFFQFIQSHGKSFFEAHFNHFFHSFEGVIVYGYTNQGNAIFFTKSQVPIRPG